MLLWLLFLLQTTDKLERDRLILFLNALIKNKVSLHFLLSLLRSLHRRSHPYLVSSFKATSNNHHVASKRLSFASIAAFLKKQTHAGHFQLISFICSACQMRSSYILFVLFCTAEKCQRDDGRQWDKSSCGSSNTGTPSHI